MGRQSTEKRRTIFFFNIYGTREVPGSKEKAVDCRFQYTKKDKTVIEEKRLSGHLLRIGHGEFTDKDNRLHKKVYVNIWDGEEEYKIELNINSQIGRSFVNTILSSEQIDWLDISCYNTKQKGTGKDFPAISIRKNKEDVTMKNKFDYEAVIKPMIRELTVNGQPVKDNGEANNFLLEKWIAHEKVLNAYAANLPINKQNAGAAADESQERPAGESQALQNEVNNFKNPGLREEGAPPPDYEPPIGSDADDLPF